MKFIRIKGAKVHNLKNIDVEIPKYKITVVTGPSGSGKSTLAFDVLYAEGQRRYIESLSSYARQFLDKIEKPDVESITGLSPAISIDQKSISKNPRSTVGTITEIYDYMRLLFAHIGEVFCYSCGRKIEKQYPQAIIDKILQKKDKKLLLLAPVAVNRKGTFKTEFEKFKNKGFVRVLVDEQERFLDEDIELDKNKKHNIYLVVDRLKIKEGIQERVADSVELALELGGGVLYVKDIDTNEQEVFSEHFACPYCGINYKPVTPQSFSFNSPLGACPECFGLGVKHQLDLDKLIPDASLSIREGVFKIWNKMRYTYYEAFLIQACNQLKIDIYTPFNELSERERDIILFGKKDEIIKFSINRSSKIRKRWDGVISLISQQFAETDSVKVKKDIMGLMKNMECPLCRGYRLNRESLSVKIKGKNIIEATRMKIRDLHRYFIDVENSLDDNQKKIAGRVLKEIKTRIEFLLDVGLDYLTLDRSAATLSGGESQRIRLATQAGSGLSGIVYVLDEPSVGLHPKDTDRLINTLKKLRDNDNTVVVVEHDENIIENSDYVIDMGPQAGINGGRVVATGSPSEIKEDSNSLTGKYLSGKLSIEAPEKFIESKTFIKIKKAHIHNIDNIDVNIPLKSFVCVTGVSGSGKSSLVFDCFYEYAKSAFLSSKRDDLCLEIVNLDKIDKIISIDQTPIGRTPRSNPATYTSVFNDIREVFAQTQSAKMQGFTASRFSFNVRGGRCERCKGEGYRKIEMQFLPDVYVKCDLCDGKRYNEATLSVKYKGKSIFDVLQMTVNQAYDFFENIPKIKHKLGIIRDVGLGYLQLGQNATTLSGGEAQRIKIAKYLISPPIGHTLYLLDEPSVGLHMDDIKKLIYVLRRLVQNGNSVIVIEHNLDIMKSADYIIDMGPDSGDKGGKIVAYGSPVDVATKFSSYTASYLKEKLNL